jgi:hypothetical protein
MNINIYDENRTYVLDFKIKIVELKNGETVIPMGFEG